MERKKLEEPRSQHHLEMQEFFRRTLVFQHNVPDTLLMLCPGVRQSLATAWHSSHGKQEKQKKERSLRSLWTFEDELLLDATEREEVRGSHSLTVEIQEVEKAGPRGLLLLWGTASTTSAASSDERLHSLALLFTAGHQRSNRQLTSHPKRKAEAGIVTSKTLKENQTLGSIPYLCAFVYVMKSILGSEFSRYKHSREKKKVQGTEYKLQQPHIS